MTAESSSRGLFGEGSLEPSAMSAVQLPDGGALLTLPNGAEKRYTEEELADYVVGLVHQAHSAPEDVDERWLEIVRMCVGEERWNQAMQILASVIR